jgi:hypothetical protein
LLGDWNAGKIGYYTVPPVEAVTGVSSAAAGWAKEFDLDAVAQDELVRLIFVLSRHVLSRHVVALCSLSPRFCIAWTRDLTKTLLHLSLLVRLRRTLAR